MQTKEDLEMNIVEAKIMGNYQLVNFYEFQLFYFYSQKRALSMAMSVIDNVGMITEIDRMFRFSYPNQSYIIYNRRVKSYIPSFIPSFFTRHGEMEQLKGLNPDLVIAILSNYHEFREQDLMAMLPRTKILALETVNS